MSKLIKKSASFLILFIFGFLDLPYCLAQQELNLHFMDQVIQSNATNPAMFTEDKLVIAAPAFTFNYGNNAFTFKDLIKKQNGLNILDIGNVLQKLHKQNVLQNQLNIDLLRIQFKVNETYFTFLASEKMNVKFNYSRELIDLLWNGNASRIGDTLSIGPSLNGRYYREIGLGIGKSYKKWTFGTRIKFLAGLADFYTQKEQMLIYTDPEAYQTTIAADFVLHTSGEDKFLDKPLYGALNFKNKGAAIDLGATYKIANSWTLAASINNIGFIKWTDNVTNYHSKASYHYKGIHLNKYFEMDTFKTKNLIDTLKNTFFPQITESAYTSFQIPRIYISTRYDFSHIYSMGVLFYAEGFKERNPAMNIYLQRKFGEAIHLGFSYAMKNRLYNNFGMSASYTKKKIQAFIVSDNFPGLVKVKDSKNVNFRMGVNLIFK